MEVIGVVLGCDNGGSDGSDCGTDAGSSSGGNVGNDDGVHSGGDAGVISAKMVDLTMVRMVVLATEAMILDLAMTNTIL